MKKFRVGVAGLGFVGLVHYEALKRLPNVEIAAVCETEETVQEKAQSLDVRDHYYSDFDKMLAECDLDCVHICTPNNLHYPMVKSALMAGVHVVCEKPLAMTAAEAIELSTLAKKKGLINAVNYNIRFYPMIHQLKCMIHNGDLGDIRWVTGSYLQDWLIYETDYNWRLDAKESGESMTVADIGSHFFDLMEFVTGEQISAVIGDFNTTYPIRKKPKEEILTFKGKATLGTLDYDYVPISVEDSANIMFRLRTGGKGALTVNQCFAGKKNSLTMSVSGSRKSAVWDSERPDEIWLGSRDGANGILVRDPSLLYPEAAEIVGTPGGHAEGFVETFKQLYKKVYSHMEHRDIEDGNMDHGDALAFPSFEDGAREMKIVERIVESNKKGEWMEVSL